jgi:hypothetical protein
MVVGSVLWMEEVSLSNRRFLGRAEQADPRIVDDEADARERAGCQGDAIVSVGHVDLFVLSG